jgi:hypothetical protein
MAKKAIDEKTVEANATPAAAEATTEGEAEAGILCQVQGREHAEAAILAFTTAFFNGVEWHLTLREGIEGQAVVDFLENIEAVTAWLASRTGWSFQGIQIGEAKVAAPAIPIRTIQPATPAGAPAPAPAPIVRAPIVQSVSETATGDNLDVQQISRHTTDNGKEYYRVKGGRYMRHGIRCWPEIAATLETYGIVLDDMEMGQAYDLSKFGLVA